MRGGGGAWEVAGVRVGTTASDGHATISCAGVGTLGAGSATLGGGALTLGIGASG